MVKKKSNSQVALAAVKAIQALLHFKEDMSREVESTLMSIFRSVAMLHGVNCFQAVPVVCCNAIFCLAVKPCKGNFQKEVGSRHNHYILSLSIIFDEYLIFFVGGNPP